MKDKLSICASCNQRQDSIFRVLPQNLLQQVENTKTISIYQPGQLIFLEGTPAFVVYHIFSGFVKLSKNGRKGEKLVIRLKGPGDIFGHRAILAGEPYTSDAMAIERTVVCAVQKEMFLKLVRECPEFALRVMERPSQDLRASEEQAMSIAQENVRERVARLLLFLVYYRENSKLDHLVIPNSLTRIEMAEMIGTTPETLSRTLKYFIKGKNYINFKN